MANIIVLESNSKKHNLKIFDDESKANEYCSIVNEILIKINESKEQEKEWVVYREEFSIEY